MLSLILGTLALGATAIRSHQSNFDVRYGDQPENFTLNVNQSFLDTIRARVATSRFITTDLGVPAFQEGPTLANATAVANHWVNHFNWSQVEKGINTFFQQYTTTIHLTEGNFTDPIPLHFVHHRSSRADAIPLLFLHGWPESFLSIAPLIEQLTNPASDSLPAFHVVAPSIPAFGFSPAPKSSGYGVFETAHTFNALMLQLGYPRYVMQAGDLGAVILRYQASLHPESVVSVLPNLWLEVPTEDDKNRLASNRTTPQETAYFSELDFFATNAAHFYTQSIAPLQAAHVLIDSPLGFAMWIYQHMGLFSPNYIWSLDEIITWTLMFLIQDAGPVGAMRTYKEYTREGAFSNGISFGELPYVPVPVGLTKRPHDVGFNLPLDWAKRGGNITTVFEHNQGGHFAAYQDPTLLIDIQEFFGNVTASGTEEFAA